MEAFGGEADDVVDAPFDAFDEGAGSALEAVGSGFVHGFAGGDVGFDLVVGHLFEGDFAFVGEAGEAFWPLDADAGDDGVGSSAEGAEHFESDFFVGRFGELVVGFVLLVGDDGVSADDQGIRVGFVDGEGLFAGEPTGGDPGIGIGEGVFIDVGGNDLEVGDAEFGEEVFAAGRSRGEDDGVGEVHVLGSLAFGGLWWLAAPVASLLCPGGGARGFCVGL